ncbi:hypothetical protein H5410_051048 [Solanum commersonii]|uniref:Uncharacterized protein n=1 Tax=Solanum commersonii TaxID=4109 RepID=A0A9J5WYU4_SOLCO|nr:hypothetical protein H5410_051048 [Solanum commersonii]
MLPSSHGHLLANKHTQVETAPINNETKIGYLCVAEIIIILGWHDSAADKAKPLPHCYFYVFLFYGHSSLQSPRSTIRYNRGQQPF